VSIAPHHLVQFIQSVNADPVVRSLSRSLSLGMATHRTSAGNFSGPSPLATLPIHEEGHEGEEEEARSSAPKEEKEATVPSASAHISFDSEDPAPLLYPPPPYDPLSASEDLVVEELVRSSNNGRTSRLARMTSRRVSEAGNSIMVVTVPQAFSLLPAASGELAVDRGLLDEERPSYSRSNTARNPWAPLPGPPMSEGMVARRSIEGSSLLRTMDLFNISTRRN
jgi:hypothetical protein